VASRPKASLRFLGWLPVAVATACVFGDPGWVYAVPNATPVQDSGRRFDVVGPDGLQLRVYADAFTGSLGAEVDVLSSKLPLPDGTHLALSVIDAAGRTLRPERAVPPISGCRTGGRAGSGFPAGAVVCSARASFAIVPMVGCSRNADLEHVKIVVTGLGDGFPSEITVPVVAL
jgi:hypothetical protein